MRNLFSLVQACTVLSLLLLASGGRAATPWSVQMHLHGSFSEGPGSLEASTQSAILAGVDVLWWSDHDQAISMYHAVSNHSFEDWTEPLYWNEAWPPTFPYELTAPIGWGLATTGAFPSPTAEISTAEAFDGAKSLKLSGSQPGANFDLFAYGFHVGHKKNPRRSLAAEVSIDIAIYPEVISADARPVVRLEMSEHGPNSVVPYFTRYKLQYFLSNEVSTAFRDEDTFYVPLAYVPGQWNTYTLAVSDDAVIGFPFIDGEDNSTHTIQLGIESRNGAQATAYFDAFQINDQIRHDALYAKKRSMLDALEQQFPQVVQLQGAELSMGSEHLNEFSVDTQLPDYDQITAESGLADASGMVQDTGAWEEFKLHWQVDRAHERDGLVSYNHPFGGEVDPLPDTPSKEEVADFLEANRVFGADLLEVGYHQRGGSIEDLLWVWDELARRGLYLVGDGVSDTHGGKIQSWIGQLNRMVTWIYADNPTKAEFVAALKGGRAFFGDNTLFDGSLDLSTPEGFRMGTVVVTDRLRQDVSVEIDGIAAGDEVRHIERGALTHTDLATGPYFSTTRSIAIGSTTGSFFRVEVRRPSSPREVVVFSNPIYFVRQVPAGGLRPERAAIDVGGVVSRSFVGFHLEDVGLDLVGSQASLRLEGYATDGVIELELPGASVPTGVSFGGGLAGTSMFSGGLLTLSDVQGSGSVVVSFPHPTIPALPPWYRGLAVVAILAVAGVVGALHSRRAV